MHLAHEVVHLVDRLGRRLDDDVDALPEHVELEVGDQGRDLDQRIGAEVEPGHLTVDPDESVIHETSPYAERVADPVPRISCAGGARRLASPLDWLAADGVRSSRAHPNREESRSRGSAPDEAVRSPSAVSAWPRRLRSSSSEWLLLAGSASSGAVHGLPGPTAVPSLGAVVRGMADARRRRTPRTGGTRWPTGSGASTRVRRTRSPGRTPRRAVSGKALLATIALRPKAKWYGDFVPRRLDPLVGAAATSSPPRAAIRASSSRSRSSGCGRGRARRASGRSTLAEKRSYKRWIDELAAGIGDTPMLVVMQPDMPFLWCAPDKVSKSRLLTYAAKTLSALSRTSVYIDAGAADWCENAKGADPARCAGLLKRTGIRYARGFALDSTHYTGPADNIAHGVKIVTLLKRAGLRHEALHHRHRQERTSDQVERHDPGHQGRPEGQRPRLHDGRHRPGASPSASRRPSASRHPKWGLPDAQRALAKRYVDGFVWFGRPWLYNQANPFVLSRASDDGEVDALARSAGHPYGAAALTGGSQSRFSTSP